MSVFGIAIGEAILILRTHALSGRERRVLIVFSTIYLVNFFLLVAPCFLILPPDRGISNGHINFALFTEHDMYAVNRT
jgi:hypothetical protein